MNTIDTLALGSHPEGEDPSTPELYMLGLLEGGSETSDAHMVIIAQMNILLWRIEEALRAKKISIGELERDQIDRILNHELDYSSPRERILIVQGLLSYFTNPKTLKTFQTTVASFGTPVMMTEHLLSQECEKIRTVVRKKSARR